ncbi:MAG: AAA family ATPase, partial [Comamonadaceae bacterium]
VEDARSRIAYLQTESEILVRERDLGMADDEAIDRVRRELDASQTRLAAFESQWAQERALASEIIDLRAQLVDEEGTGHTPVDAASAAAVSAASLSTTPGIVSGAVASNDGVATRTHVLERLKAAQAELSALQQEHPLIQSSVDAQAVAAVVADWTGIPLGRMMADRMQAVLDLVQTLEGRVIGQSGALHAIAQRVQTATARLDDPDKPVGVFLLCGPSGVGKTETALALAESLYGGEQNMISLNMSEFQEPHTVSTLKGAPPGYVGFGEGGVLTEAVRRRPYSVVLLDEIEKAHPDVHELFFQVFDKGWMEDGEGRYIDFRNTLILLTSNVGTDLLTDLFRDPDLAPAYEGLAQALRAPLLKVFPPALLGRMTVVPYLPLDDATLSGIVTLQVDRIRQRMLDNHGVEMSWSEGAIDLIRARCTETASGARN